MPSLSLLFVAGGGWENNDIERDGMVGLTA